LFSASLTRLLIPRVNVQSNDSTFCKYRIAKYVLRSCRGLLAILEGYVTLLYFTLLGLLDPYYEDTKIFRYVLNCKPSVTASHIGRLCMFSSTAVRTSDLTIPVARLEYRSLDRITGFGDLVRDK
jgi:hypothetical protein